MFCDRCHCASSWHESLGGSGRCQRPGCDCWEYVETLPDPRRDVPGAPSLADQFETILDAVWEAEKLERFIDLCLVGSKQREARG